MHQYVLPIHPRDLDHPQFAWHLQRQIYDGLHDYFIEMFVSTPQDKNPGPAPIEQEPKEAPPGKKTRIIWARKLVRKPEIVGISLIYKHFSRKSLLLKNLASYCR